MKLIYDPGGTVGYVIPGDDERAEAAGWMFVEWLNGNKSWHFQGTLVLDPKSVDSSTCRGVESST